MTKQKFSDEDLKELLAYIASNPAIPFPTLSKEEREELIQKVLEQLDEIEKAYRNPKLIIDIIKSSKKFEE